ncbi:MAG: hypothetical protein II996_03020 [Oscillospiraceae bacterium]|nr:hypothetical protein [Oscillospiraceae bacterium]MBQ4544523.1 hypothetical protein [Oscillospiraceae bacterium]MBQ6901756.1 hypothetical protein [Oscillospiraceae bacterium]
MNREKNAGFSALFFPEHSDDPFVMYVSSSPPQWLDANDMSKITVTETGIYCLFFLVNSDPGGSAYISVNGRSIRGSYAEERSGSISGSAVCSIRELALPCSLSIETGGAAGAGILLVVKCMI